MEHKAVRIMEIVVQVIEELRGAHNVEDIDIEKLRGHGYSEAEISTAVSWLLESLDLPGVAYEERLKSRVLYRSLHPAERHIFSKEAQGELIQMQSLGIINPLQVETIIERSFAYGASNIDKQQLYSIVADLIFKQHPLQTGSRTLLNFNSTIH